MRPRLAISAVLFVLVVPASAAHAAKLTGRVVTSGHPLAGARVTLAAAPGSRLGRATTDRRGRFAIAYQAPADAVVYAVASRRAVRLMAVAAGAPRRLTVNELTTVAAAYSLARFLHGARVSGPAPGLPNAALTVSSLVRASTGRIGRAIANPPNGTATQSLVTFRTLAAILGGCTTGSARTCARLFAAAAPAGGARPANTLDAIHAIALNPAHNVRRIFNLPKTRFYRPVLGDPPSSWVLTLLHTDAAAKYDGPGRMAFDSKGNIWVTNNFNPGTADAGLCTISLDPAGHPRNGGAVCGGGIQGNWWGIAIDRADRVWLSNFTGADPNPFYSSAFVGGNAASLFTSDAKPLSGDGGITAGNLAGPQGIAVDVNDNVWIANHTGDSVTLYPKGDPSRAQTITGGGISEPFAIAGDSKGNVWIDNGAIDINTPGSLTKIAPGAAPVNVGLGGLRSPQGIAVDSADNVWVTSLADSTVTWVAPDGTIKGTFRAPSIEGAWSVAIDGDDNVWVASFINQKVTELCGRVVANCPPGAKTGDPISPSVDGYTNGGLQHVTAVQVDASGNVWAANNWQTVAPIVGGNGLVEYIGAAAPVRTPLIGAPERPR